MAGAKSNPAEDTSKREIVITRLIGAPRELVFDAFTDIQHLSKWWGPRGFTISTQKISVKTGGMWQFMMHGPDGRNFPNWIFYDEIIKPERLVYSVGSVVGKPAEFQSIVTFETQGSKTKLTMRGIFPTAEARDFVVKAFNAVEGGEQTVDRLEEHVARIHAGKAFLISRDFDAPRELLFKVWTESEHLKQWFGPKGTTIQVSKMDLRTGGSYHYCMRTADGHDMWGKWEFREIVPPERIVLIHSFSDENGNRTRHPMSATWPLEMLSTTTFVENDGKTTLMIEWVPINATEEEIRTFTAAFDGMTMGWSGTMEQLTAYLANPSPEGRG